MLRECTATIAVVFKVDIGVFKKTVGFFNKRVFFLQTEVGDNMGVLNC